jgi:hypothetical protein
MRRVAFRTEAAPALIRLPSGASTWARPGTRVTGSLKVTVTSVGE